MLTVFRKYFVGFGQVFWRAILRFQAQNDWAMSSHVALSMMFAIFPFTIFVLAVAGMVSSDIASEDLVYLVFGSWPEPIAGPIEKEVRAVLNQGGTQTITLGAILTVYFASNGVEAMRVAITEQYSAHDPRSFWRTRCISVIFVLAGTVLVVFAALVFGVVPLYIDLTSERVPEFVKSLFMSNLLRSIMMMSLLLFAVFACHAWLPGVRRSDRTILPGVIVTILLWILSAKFLAYYITKIATYSLTYAGLAGVMSALIFLYLMSAILIFGAGFNDELAKWLKSVEQST
jgi:membrane protein